MKLLSFKILLVEISDTVRPAIGSKGREVK